MPSNVIDDLIRATKKNEQLQKDLDTSKNDLAKTMRQLSKEFQKNDTSRTNGPESPSAEVRSLRAEVSEMKRTLQSERISAERVEQLSRIERDGLKKEVEELAEELTTRRAKCVKDMSEVKQAYEGGLTRQQKEETEVHPTQVDAGVAL